jgi:hypothetical protein
MSYLPRNSAAGLTLIGAWTTADASALGTSDAEITNAFSTTALSNPRPKAGVLEAIAVRLSGDVGAAGNDVVATVYKNGVATLLTATVTGAGGTENEATATVTPISFAAGDDLTVQAKRVGTPGAVRVLVEVYGRMTSASPDTLAGDVTGAIGTNTVEKIRGKTVDAPVAGDDGQFARYNHGAGTISWEAASGGGGGSDEDTYANLIASTPASGTTGWPTNGPYVLRYEGGWSHWGPLFKLTPPVDGDFSWVNQGTASVDTTDGGIYLEAPATAGTNVRLRVKSAPATPYTITAAFIPSLTSNSGTDPGMGLLWRESSTGEFVALAYTITGTTGPFVRLQKWTNATTFSAQYVLSGSEWERIDRFQVGPLIWFQISDNGTNLIGRVSNDGKKFRQAWIRSRTDFMASGPDQIGVWCHSNGTAADVGMWLLHWSES